MVKIEPAILTNNPKEGGSFLANLEGVVERVQIDVIDGIYADNKTLDPIFFKDLEISFDLDYHLMVKEPINWIVKCVSGQAGRIIGQIEMMENQMNFITKVREENVEAGLALDLDTPVERIEKEALGFNDVLLLMSVKAGFGGQKFEESVLKKIEKVASLKEKENLNFKILVDGGINAKNLKKLEGMKVDEVAIGRAILHGDIEDNIKKLTKVLEKND